MNIDLNWNYKTLLSKLESLKSEYKEILGSFIWHDLKKRNKFIYECKETIYSLKIKSWQKDKVWEYLNNDYKISSLESYLIYEKIDKFN